MNQDPHIVCPSASELSKEFSRNVMCPVAGCQKILPHVSALRFHKIKVHRLIESETDRRVFRHQKAPEDSLKVACQFHCPSSNCLYSVNNVKHFTSYKLLKQHYMRMHAPPCHVCSACQASFGLAYDLARHVKNCLFATNNKDHSNKPSVGTDKSSDQELVKSSATINSRELLCVDMQTGVISVNSDQRKVESSATVRSHEQLSVGMQTDVLNSDLELVRCRVGTFDTDTCSLEDRRAADGTTVTLNKAAQKTSSPRVRTCDGCSTVECCAGKSLCYNEPRDDDRTAKILISQKINSASPVPIKSGKNETAQKRSRSKHSAQAPATLLMKPNAILMPIYLPVVILPGVGHSSFTSGRLTNPPSIAPKPPADKGYSKSTIAPRLGANDSTLSLSSTSDSRSEFRSELVSSIGTQCSLASDGLGLKKTRCSQSTNVLRRKVAETQTVPCVGLREVSSRQFRKAASQVSARAAARSYRAICHSHTQTHGDHRNLRRHLVAAVGPHPDSSPNSFWPDVASNATQTVGAPRPGDCESTRTQTSESYLSEFATQSDNMLFNEGTWLPVPDSSSGYGTDMTAVEKFCEPSRTPPAPDLCSNNDGGLESFVNSKLDASSVLNAEYRLDSMPGCHNNELFQSTRDVSVQFDQLLDELVMSSSTQGTQVTDDLSLSRLMFTSASQTVAIDFDAVSTQTMECDFDAVDFDFANTETQTNDLFDTYFGFSDIETQTAHDMQLWDSQTQTCFDSFNI